ncbi:RNA-binding protein [Heracleum sosnowskyi]|uniref:RNA-binding protein n=1 Tax=Heracleum sosnowskyi TaxID=360622 RepID=A0AAD8HGB2_9APIA|nr:RNA-binding protein [Heracleum sosnowskyi]
MKSSKLPTIRVFGQRPISSQFLSASSKSDGKEDGQCKAPRKDMRVSLSNFLDRKLQKGSKSVKGKQEPFSSPVIGMGVSGCRGRENTGNKIGEPELNCDIDVAFEKLKSTADKKEGCISLPADEFHISNICHTQGSRKRSRPDEGMDEKAVARKVLVTLGDNNKNAHNPRKTRFFSHEKPKPLFNHYANGSGWWDSNMEGVDNDEVGCHEMWEGVGSTTLGGLEWN